MTSRVPGKFCEGRRRTEAGWRLDSLSEGVEANVTPEKLSVPKEVVLRSRLLGLDPGHTRRIGSGEHSKKITIARVQREHASVRLKNASD